MGHTGPSPKHDTERVKIDGRYTVMCAIIKSAILIINRHG